MLCSCMQSDRLPLVRVATYEMLETATVEAAHVLVMTAARSLQTMHDPLQQYQLPLALHSIELTLNIHSAASRRAGNPHCPMSLTCVALSEITSFPQP